MSITEKTISVFSLRDDPDNLIAGVPVYIKKTDGTLAGLFKIADAYKIPTECGAGVECGEGGQCGDYLTAHLEPQNNPVYTNEIGQVSIWADNSIEYKAEIISDAPKNTGFYARSGGDWVLFATRNYTVECGGGVGCGEGGECGDYTGFTAA